MSWGGCSTRACMTPISGLHCLRCPLLGARPPSDSALFVLLVLEQHSLCPGRQPGPAGPTWVSKIVTEHPGLTL